jgi:hypothetical protein
MKPREYGRVQKRTRWCFIEHGAEPVPFTALAIRCFGTSKLSLPKRWSIYRALRIYGAGSAGLVAAKPGAHESDSR